jgi:hypothetical protein
LDVTGTLVVVGTRVWELVHTARINLENSSGLEKLRRADE